MITLCSYEECTGCMACYNACKHNAITMKEDEEGFLYPQINETLCINCQLCVKKCPILQGTTLQSEHFSINPTIFAARTKDLNILKTSASGGIFTTLAAYVLKRKGIVYGAAFNQKLYLNHIRINDIKDLNRLQGSKYLQSYIGDVYKKVKLDLQAKDNIVLFSGTPCQIAGLKQYLYPKDYPNLFLIDIICHGVPSQKIFNAYCKKISKYPITAYKFRNTQTTEFVSQYESNKKIHYPRYTDRDYYIRAYLKGFLHRKSCYNCKFSRIPRQGDISIGDFWSIISNKTSSCITYEHGISCILLNTIKGEKLYKSVKHLFIDEEKTLAEATIENHNIISGDKFPPERNKIYNDFFNLSPKEVVSKYNLLEKRPSIKNQIIHFLRKKKKQIWNNL